MSSPKFGYSYARLYSDEEDIKIAKFIAQRNEFHRVRGDHVWKLMEESGELQPRTWQSLKQHFWHKVVHRVAHPKFQLTPEEIAKFREVSMKKWQKPLSKRSDNQVEKEETDEKLAKQPCQQFFIPEEVYVPRYRPPGQEDFQEVAQPLECSESCIEVLEESD